MVFRLPIAQKVIKRVLKQATSEPPFNLLVYLAFVDEVHINDEQVAGIRERLLVWYESNPLAFIYSAAERTGVTKLRPPRSRHTSVGPASLFTSGGKVRNLFLGQRITC